jgi:uncharacterized protein (DUF433 family)
MSVQIHNIVPGDASDIHDEPHIEGSRVTVQHVHARVGEAGLTPEQVADKLNLDIADVYAALSYYHNNPAEMRDVEQRREAAFEEMDDLQPPE